MPQPLSIAHIVNQLRTLGVRSGDLLLVHTSYRAVRPVDQGPLGLLQALREAVGPSGTLVMPTMTAGDAPFDPTQTPTLDMGITAELFWRQPNTLRSTHPGASCAAQGPRAVTICAPHPLEPPHGIESPIGRVYTLHGKVLLLGVQHSENTTIHLAESLADVPYSVRHPCVIERDGAYTTALIAETDHCCVHFNRVAPILQQRNAQTTGPVGHATAHLCASRDVVDAAHHLLRANPLVFLCDAHTGCEECDRAHASIS